MANNIGWGQAHANNSIDFGAAPDASNSFGAAYEDSYSGDTEILGGAGPENTVAPAITGTPERGEVLTCSSGTWTGTGVITYAYQWQRNGANISGATANTYTLVAADDNATIKCVVTATDDEGSRNASSNEVTALGAPFNLVAPVLSGTEQVGETLSVTDGTWQGVTPITYAYKWFRDGVEIGGETSSTYTLVAADYNTVINAEVTATNSIDSTAQDSNDTGLITGAVVNLTPPVLSGTEQAGEVLSVTDGTWEGTLPITYAYQWRRDGVNIGSATSSTYLLVEADYDTIIDCVVTATNLINSADATSNATNSIAGVTPSITGVPTFTGTENVAEDLTAVYATSDGVPAPTDSIQWQRSADGVSGWVDISGATSLVYTLVLADEGNYVRCVQTSTNAVGSATANSVASGEIQPEVTFTPLLDVYSGAAAGYSVKLLRTAYAGALVRIRRSSDNAEKDFYHDANFELSLSSEDGAGTSLATWIGVNDGFVTTWYDQSGNAIDATQSTASAQPKVVSAGVVVTENGKPALDFNGLQNLVNGQNGTTPSQVYAFAVRGLAVYPSSFKTLFNWNRLGITHNSNGGGSYGNGAHIFKNATTQKSDDYPTTTGQALDVIINETGLERNAFAATLAAGGGYSAGSGSIGSFSGSAQRFTGTFQELVIYESDESANKAGIKSNTNDFYSIY